MATHKEEGTATQLFLIVLLLIGFVGASAFGYWAYSGRQDYKNQADKKITVAVAAAKSKQEKELQQNFEEQSKKPYKSYNGPSTYGSLAFAYPKSWNAYIDETNDSTPINAYFYPNFVPAINNSKPYALRVQMLDEPYSSVVQQFSSQTDTGSLKASAYIPSKMKDKSDVQPGIKFDGQIEDNKTGSILVIKVRDKTLKIYTESNEFLPDFNNTVLASLSFAP